MSRYAIINGALVENVIIADAAPDVPGRIVIDVSAIAVGPGDTYDGKVFTPRVPSAREVTKATAPGNLRRDYAGLKQWAQDAATTDAGWAALSAAQKDTIQRTVIRRLGIFFDRSADLLVTLDLDG